MRFAVWPKDVCALLLVVALGMPEFACASQELNQSGLAAYRRGDLQEAAHLFEQAIQSFSSALGARHPDTLRSMNNLAATYRALGRTADQLVLSEKVLGLSIEILGERHPETLTSMNNLAVAYGALGRKAEQLALNEKVLRLTTEIRGERHPSTLASMSNLAFTYGALGRTSEQLAVNEKVLRLRREVQGERHPDTLFAMGNLAATFGSLGRRAEELTLNEQVLHLRTEILGQRHPDTLRSMTSLAGTYGALGRTAEQLVLNESVLRLSTEVFGERHPHTLASMNNLALTYGALGRGDERMVLSEKVLRLNTEILGERHADTLSSMSNLATAYGAVGRNAERLTLNEKVVRLRSEILGERHPDTLTSMNNLASTFGALGRTAEQLALIEKVLRLEMEVLGERHPDTLVTMGNLAAVYDSLGRTSEVLALSEKVLRLETETLGERHPLTMNAMNNLAATYFKLGRAAEHLVLSEKVVRLMTDVMGERHPRTLIAMNNLAFAYGAQRRVPEQLALNEKVLRLRTDVLGPRHPDTLTAMANLAGTYNTLGRTADQLALNEDVLRLMTDVRGDRHPDTLTSIHNLARTYAIAKRPDAAAGLSARYVAGAEWQRSQPGLTPENRQSIFRIHAERYRFFSTALGTTGKVAESLQLSELGKARTLLESMAAQRAGRSGALPKAELDKLEDLNRRAASLNRTIAQADSPEAKQIQDATRNEVERQFDALQTRLKSQYPKYAQLSDVKIVGASDLRGLISRDAIAVSYMVSGNDLSAFVADGTGTVRFAGIGVVPNLPDAVDILRRGQSDERPLKEILGEEGRRAWRLPDGSYRLLDATQPAPKDASEVLDAREVAQYLSAKLLQPLAKDLQGKPRWIISPDGPLAQLTFETLPFGDKGEPAVAAAEIHYTQSLSVYALSRNLQKQYESLKDRQSLFAMGNPEYSQRALNPRERRGLKRNTNVRGAQQLQEMDALWQDLPGTEAEVKAVARLFPGSAATYLGPQATEQQLQALNDKGQLKNYRYLLMSAHGYLAPEQPALSSIVLGLRNRTPDADGYVTASEWPGYDLRSDLMVLSACDSGVGKVVSGEGVMGLPFALFVAGNVNTILSLWPVDDEATAAFVTSLFTKLKAGQGASQALANTKREFLRHKDFGHPSYWAPFILVGAG